IKFDNNSKIKFKSIKLSEDLINFLSQNNLESLNIEPLVGFVNQKIVVINIPLNDENLFIDELLYRISHGKRKLSPATVKKISILLANYSSEHYCS
ncbi:MAG: NERD domain-containing protein, partial [Methanobrevibacter sp.]|nr:NERD domain-containing protein [Methanobrevibacter sp.]